MSAVVGVSVMGAIQGLYILVLPRNARIYRYQAGRLVAHAGVVVVGSGAGAALAAVLLSIAADVDPADSIVGLFRTSVVVSALVVGMLLTVDGLQQHLLEARMREERAVQHALRSELRALQALLGEAREIQ